MKTKIINNFVILFGLLISHLAFAAPEGGVVAAGTADISKSGNTTNINQTSSSAVINWQSFDTVGNETVKFNQPNSNSTVLNRINSGLPTNFAGSLFANGKVFIVNPAGMVFAQGANINAASFVATTVDIKDTDFMQGQYKFAVPTDSHPSEAFIINNGNITADEYGMVALIAPNVINANTGVITASEGNVILATGKSFVLDFNQDGLINFDVTSLITNGHIENAGKISAYDGNVFMTTNTVSNIVNNMTSMNTIKEANNAAVNARGEVVLAPLESYAVGTITNTGDISTKYVKIKADNGINLSGSITSDGWLLGNIEASTQKGDVLWNGILSAPCHITLSSKEGAITVPHNTGVGAGWVYFYSPLPPPNVSKVHGGYVYMNDRLIGMAPGPHH